ncbi:glycoside hydrolase [Fulvitalea axinellae]|uniref:Glycoside hydrolase n=1 Tax=Fulvitalea axinellae TaxID=1182444 RepID=A0AAU9D4Y9_9BACT|nr:glycoside hydrolase [Fulvitalea axinellae]
MLRKYIASVLLTLISAIGLRAADLPGDLTVKIRNNEYWWPGVVALGEKLPFDKETNLSFDLNTANGGNQTQPMLIASSGRLIWSDKPFKFEFREGEILITETKGKVQLIEAGKNLKEAYRYASRNFFPPSGKMPAEVMFQVPQYNTWIELMYDQNQRDILKYAHDIIDNGLPPGVLMIDDNWQEDYGKWNFHEGRFSDPKAMMKELHGMGFKVMLWVCPFVSPDCDEFRALSAKKAFLIDGATGEPKMVKWWNGYSAVLDLSHPEAVKWFKSKLDRLQDEYGVDGYKLDAGDNRFYTGNVKSYVPGMTPTEHSASFGEIGLDYPLNEYRAMWKMAGQPLAQRLHDKNHDWGALYKLIPQLATQGVSGYAFTCPDMIGGGQYKSFLEGAIIDQELIVRSAQCHALMPMMQFSVAPWRVLDKEHLKKCLDAVKIRDEVIDDIMRLAKDAKDSGEPIVRLMEYNYPQQGFHKVRDQFMLGDEILVAPVIKKGARKRAVILPPGKWVSTKGKTFRGPKTITVDAPLDEIPYFRKK